MITVSTCNCVNWVPGLVVRVRQHSLILCLGIFIQLPLSSSSILEWVEAYLKGNSSWELSISSLPVWTTASLRLGLGWWSAWRQKLSGILLRVCFIYKDCTHHHSSLNSLHSGLVFFPKGEKWSLLYSLLVLDVRAWAPFILDQGWAHCGWGGTSTRVSS